MTKCIPTSIAPVLVYIVYTRTIHFVSYKKREYTSMHSLRIDRVSFCLFFLFFVHTCFGHDVGARTARLSASALDFRRSRIAMQCCFYSTLLVLVAHWHGLVWFPSSGLFLFAKLRRDFFENGDAVSNSHSMAEITALFGFYTRYVNRAGG